MTSNFTLLKLPLIPLELIIEQLDFLDLVRLSLKSTKLKGILQVLKLPVQRLDVFVTERFYGIKILRNRNFSSIYACDSVPVDTITEQANIQGEPVQIWNHGRNKMKVKSDLSKLATLEAITKLVLSISKVANYALNYDDVKTEIRSLFIWQLTTQFDHLNISPNHGSRVQISPEDLTFLLEEISVFCLHMNVYSPGFKYQKPIKHSAIFSQSPSWMDFEKFSLGPETIIANFSDQEISSDVLNRLIQDWAEGKNPKLKEVQFTWTDSGPDAVAQAREQQIPHRRTILPNRNVEQLKEWCIKHLVEREINRDYVLHRVLLYVGEDFGSNGVHLENQA